MEQDDERPAAEFSVDWGDPVPIKTSMGLPPPLYEIEGKINGPASTVLASDRFAEMESIFRIASLPKLDPNSFVVSGRLLHGMLGIKENQVHWAKRRIAEHGFGDSDYRLLTTREQYAECDMQGIEHGMMSRRGVCGHTYMFTRRAAQLIAMMHQSAMGAEVRSYLLSFDEEKVEELAASMQEEPARVSAPKKLLEDLHARDEEVSRLSTRVVDLRTENANLRQLVSRAYEHIPLRVFCTWLTAHSPEVSFGSIICELERFGWITRSFIPADDRYVVGTAIEPHLTKDGMHEYLLVHHPDMVTDRLIPDIQLWRYHNMMAPR